MPALSDTMLAGGCAQHIEAIHGERVQVLDGPDAGKWFSAVREIQGDQILTSDLGEDPRAKIFLRFIEGSEPQLGSLRQGEDRVTAGNGTPSGARNPPS